MIRYEKIRSVIIRHFWAIIQRQEIVLMPCQNDRYERFKENTRALANIKSHWRFFHARFFVDRAGVIAAVSGVKDDKFFWSHLFEIWSLGLKSRAAGTKRPKHPPPFFVGNNNGNYFSGMTGGSPKALETPAQAITSPVSGSRMGCRTLAEPCPLE